MSKAPNFITDKYGVRKINGYIKNTYRFGIGSKDKRTVQIAKEILVQCGGVALPNSGNSYKFDYDCMMDVFPIVYGDGAVPDEKSFQYYPTPTNLAQRAVDWLNIGDSDNCLEPSAGQGGLLDFMPKSTTAIEISELHCGILTSKGFENVINKDFIEYASDNQYTDNMFDKILMNPPFSGKRWLSHITSALTLLDVCGVLVAILPSSAKNMKQDPLYSYEFSEEIEFDGVSIKVILCKITPTVH